MNLDSILENTDITLLTKVDIVKAMFFPVVMYGYDSWSIKKTKHQKVDSFNTRFVPSHFVLFAFPQ